MQVKGKPVLMSKSKNYLTVDRTGVCNCKLKGNQSKEMA